MAACVGLNVNWRTALVSDCAPLQVTTWESRGSRPIPGTAEGRLALVLGPGDDGPMRTLADFSDADLIEELATRLGLTTIRVNSDPSRGVRPPDGVGDVTTDETTQRCPSPRDGSSPTTTRPMHRLTER